MPRSVQILSKSIAVCSSTHTVNLTLRPADVSRTDYLPRVSATSSNPSCRSAWVSSDHSGLGRHDHELADTQRRRPRLAGEREPALLPLFNRFRDDHARLGVHE